MGQGIIEEMFGVPYKQPNTGKCFKRRYLLSVADFKEPTLVTVYCSKEVCRDFREESHPWLLYLRSRKPFLLSRISPSACVVVEFPIREASFDLEVLLSGVLFQNIYIM